MPYFDLQKITPPAPNDPNVNEVTQLNDNWDDISAKMGFYIGTSSVPPSNPQEGQEWQNSATGSVEVWTGSAWYPVQQIEHAWSAFTAFDIQNSAEVASNKARYRTNSLLRRFELWGRLSYLAAGTWPAGELEVTAQTGNVIPPAFSPLGNKATFNIATSGIGGASSPKGFRAVVDQLTGTGVLRTRIRLTHMGASSSGEEACFDGIAWYY